MIEQETKTLRNVDELTITADVTCPDMVIEEKKSTDEMTKLVAKGGSISFAGMSFRRVTNFLFQIFLTRILGVSAYGIYTLGYSVMSITGYISMLGLPNASMRFGAIYHATGDNKRLKGCFLLALSSATIIAVSTMVLLLIFSETLALNFFKKPELTGVIKIFALSVPFFALFMVSAASLRGLKNMKYSTVISEVFPSLSNLLIVGIAFLLGFRLIGAVYGFVIASALTAGLGLYLLWRLSARLVLKAKPIFEPRKIFGYSLMVLLVDFSYLLLSQTDRIMLGYSTTAQNVGIYGAAAILALQLPIFLNSINGIFSPVIADLHSTNQMEQLNSLLKTNAKWTFSLTLPFFAIIVLFPDIIKIFGPKFAAGWPVLVILGAAQLLHVSTGSSQATLIMCGKQKLELYNGVVMASLNILLNILLIPLYGILGAAIATGISIVLVSFTRLIEIYICFRIHPYKRSFLKPIAAGITAGGLWYLLNLIIPFKGYAWIGGIVIYATFYITALWWLGFDQEDKVIIHAIKRRLLRQ